MISAGLPAGLGFALLLGGCSSMVPGHDSPPEAAPDAGPPGDEQAPAEATCSEKTFDLTETEDFFKVPPGGKYMHVKAWGAGGNGEGQCGLPDTEGGLGGFTEVVLAVEPGQELTVIVGQRGRAGYTNEEKARFGFGAWGGGGLSGVFDGARQIEPNDQARALVIAGGGGSSGWGDCRPGGTGNHPNSGGRASMEGELGANNELNGGGGGYSGGVGGAPGMPGAGGEGFMTDSKIDGAIHYENPGAGMPPRSDDPDYVSPAGATEQPGLVVIKFTCEPPEIPEPDNPPPQVD